MYDFDPTISSAVQRRTRADRTAAERRRAARAGTARPDAPLLDAANYLTVGQIYLQENPLLREPLRPEQIKPRLLGHWGTSPGLSFIYVHLNRLIQRAGCRTSIYLAGPGHGGPALVAQRLSGRHVFGDLPGGHPG